MKKIIYDINSTLFKLSESTSYDILNKAIVDGSVKLFKAKYVDLILKQNGELKKVYSSSPGLLNVKIRKTGFIYRSYKYNKLKILGLKQIKIMDPEYTKNGIKSIIISPLFHKNSSIGVLSLLFDHSKGLSEKDLNLLKFFCSYISILINNYLLAEEIKQVSMAKNFLISASANRFRTTLTSINGYTQMLQKNLKSTDLFGNRVIGQLHFETLRLTFLVNELFEINKAQSGESYYDFRVCSLLDIINKVINLVKKYYPERKIIFLNELLGCSLIAGDENKLFSAFFNILDNSLKYSNQDVCISLKESQRHFILKVRDKGVKIPKNNKITKLVVNEEIMQRNIGLLMVKDIIDHHRGFLDINPKVNKGTSVEIKLRKVRLY